MTYRKGGEGFLSQISLGNTGLMVLVFLTEGFFRPLALPVCFMNPQEKVVVFPKFLAMLFCW